MSWRDRRTGPRVHSHCVLFIQMLIMPKLYLKSWLIINEAYIRIAKNGKEGYYGMPFRNKKWVGWYMNIVIKWVRKSTMNFKSKKPFFCFVGPFKSMDVDSFVIEKLVLRDKTWVDPRVNAGHSTKSGSTVRQVQRVAEVVTESSANSMVVWRMEEFTAVHIGFRKLILIGTGSNWRAQRGSHQSNNQQNNHRLWITHQMKKKRKQYCISIGQSGSEIAVWWVNTNLNVLKKNLVK